MKNTIYKYFFHEFIRYFLVVLFASSAVIWTIQAVNFLDLVTEDGHAFKIYLTYSFLTLPKILTKLIPFTFLVASILTIFKLEKDNELIILWASGLNKIHIVNLIFRISVLTMFLQLVMASLINPQTLFFSRNIIKDSELQFIPSLLKEKKFNTAVENLTIFVDKKKKDGTYENIFIRDEGTILTNISDGSSTIFAKSGYISNDRKSLVLLNGSIQKLESGGEISIIKFARTSLNLSGLSTKTTAEHKIQETSTLHLIRCLIRKNIRSYNCSQTDDSRKDLMIEINKRFGMPFYIPLIGLITCFLLSSRKENVINRYSKHLYFFICFIILTASEIAVRYSGLSFDHSISYYLIPLLLLPLVYFLLIRSFKYENLK